MGSRRARCARRRFRAPGCRPPRHAGAARTVGGLAGAAAEHPPELTHAPRDPLVNLVEHLTTLIHRVADRPRLNWSGIEAPRTHHSPGRPPEPPNPETPRRRSH